MNKLLIIVFTTLLAANAFAQDECVRAVPSALILDTSKVKDYSYSKTESNEVTESFSLLNEQQVTIIQAGCSHYYLTFRFVTPLFPKQHTVGKAIELYNQVSSLVPLHSKTINNSLQSVNNGKQAPESITVTEGYDWVYLSTSYNDKNLELVLTYDIAL